MRDANRNQLWARAVTEELVRAGVGRVLVAPGSRSTPLVLEAASREGLRLMTHLDERSAGFFALGLGKATGRPAAVITTSGTAAANLLPSVVEASQSEVPLLLLTADRPPHLRDADANQAIDQIHLYGRFVRRFVDVAPPSVDGRSLRHLRSQTARAVADALGPPAGPVHMNFPFRKPLEPTPVEGDVDPGFLEQHPRAGLGRGDGSAFIRVRAGWARPDPGEIEGVAGLLSEAERGLVVVGPSPLPGRTGPAAIALAAA
ncbi:MAG TPA: 2-succinyl-5-enolpyruvyl-6-hydroxy-3-cyclohexene-1-carboxylic-acid synthase, partial [Longimicrobiales bacterium]|nr:2-succinyl-5-enolpyruvyl-6-hydroxy-3-cyclohexene-1-carboxylic-acid synthase [Longimicrobiales bacterium]